MSQPLSPDTLVTPAGRNLAPVKPIQKLAEGAADSPYAKNYLTDSIKAKYQELLARDERSRKEMIANGQLIALFIEGKQILDWNPYTQAYSPRNLRRTDPNKIKAVNFMRYYCTNWQSKWGSSNPDVILTAFSNKDTDMVRAKKANAVVDYLEYKMYDKWFNYHEGMLAQVFGWYGRRVGVCYKDAHTVLKNIIGEKQVKIGAGFGKCYECQFSGKADVFSGSDIVTASGLPSASICPECNSTDVYIEPAAVQLMPAIIGQEPIHLPNIKTEQIPFPSCAWDYKFRAEDSGWFIYEKEISKGSLRQLVGNRQLPEGGSGNELGLEVMRSLAEVGSPINGRSDTGFNSQEQNRTTYCEMFLSPEEAYDIWTSDEKTVDGSQLPNRKRLSEVFPKGCKITGYNGLSLIETITDGRQGDTLTSGVYHMKALSGTGQGVGDAVEIQKRFNRQDSQYVRAMAAQATPATLWAEGAISQNDKRKIGQPDVDIPIKLQNFPDGTGLPDLFHQLQPKSVPGDAMNYTYTHLQNFMQLAYHITDFSGGLGNRVRNDTATGAEILDANADALFAPALNIKADVGLKNVQKAFFLWRDTTPVKRFIS